MMKWRSPWRHLWLRKEGDGYLTRPRHSPRYLCQVENKNHLLDVEDVSLARESEKRELIGCYSRIAHIDWML